MKVRISGEKIQGSFVQKVEEISGENVLSCYQCGKCSAGCPSVTAMDLLPNQVIRLVQLGLEDVIAESQTMWLCASCQTCAVRCPRGVDLAKVMEAVRLLSLRRNENYIEPSKLPPELIEELPPIALISNFRKFTG
ncbi:MAG: 4Fe-4S dicluster domain-containing protein [candidate division KSB1 bacterium]|nr:4Fe-4S dicluster domain-containing protein [candidate division KSB1 bacterium]